MKWLMPWNIIKYGFSDTLILLTHIFKERIKPVTNKWKKIKNKHVRQPNPKYHHELLIKKYVEQALELIHTLS